MVQASPLGVAVCCPGIPVFQSSSSSEARFPLGSASWGSCSKSADRWQASLLRLWGPAVLNHLWTGEPLLARGARGVRNSTGGGLQSVGNMSVACTLGFFDDLEVRAEVGVQRRRPCWSSPWPRGWSKPLCFRPGMRMGAVAAAWTSVNRMNTVGSPPAPPPHCTSWVRRGGNSGML